VPALTGRRFVICPKTGIIKTQLDTGLKMANKKQIELKEFIENINKKDNKRNGLKVRFAFTKQKR
jgi:hypothetical protein